MSQDKIAAHFQLSLAAMTAAAGDATLLAASRAIAAASIKALEQGRKILLAGNGGSAADAQHIAAEIIGRYKRDRAAWPAVALTTDTSALTAIANDYGFERVFARQVEGLGQPGDVFIGITTSGRSPNILAALEVARQRGLVTVGMTGPSGGSMGALCDHLLIAPGPETALVQQIHLMAAHAICDEIEVVLGKPAP
ncbi:D-sedoheptulose 7-phosphate isomerase [Rhodopseudomonas palustris]|uniref:Phosphoheptose isomerase n=1 Tax=Rhodopseudomonas palustris (strain ATCC BAA-98 / CGA009) TaxID=258594 RepID=Q6N2R2_RHOPA|nr:D-sedoheptulose 7-phosphate isomerase [Rhodopseudomonas palustris]OPF92599.1 sugar isomerase [Rhodopseudomonas palustris]PPQ43425.1 sugar isomerase [Rhodopseudomonas palustris]QQM05547.1 Phosphoheptose isomerase [Rhodopseudomonas palustris]RJF63301.1 SIS domain-containing protein [Rhodopseudomonas palustris]WAB76880.1 D-sedoheptulose 7-phosphate isomerase [Rhodopseudomonas palustris]